MALFQKYGHYNYWANQQICSWLLTQPDAIFQTETPSSFNTLRATLQHIWGAETIWLNRLRGISLQHFPGAGFQGSNPELCEQLLDNSQGFKSFLQQCEPDFFSKTTSYQHTGGQSYTQLNSDIVLHCLQHSTFHRGQLVTMGRSLGLTQVPKTDYIQFVRLLG